MSLCIVCGQSNPDRPSFCSFHVTNEEDWSTANRIMCDLVRRAIVPRRLPACEREPVEIITDDEGEVVVLEAR
ncbi:MAG: hypothetical protein FJZ38_15930 [Candidatus Rokubacteria bacterium]|nr:hypothetical protein [Candidatus Rokubacteria bacterium]